MAQTRKKRRTKHRGTAAGTVEARGRTGRKPTKQEKGKPSRAGAREGKPNRLDRPPTWRSAATRGGIAALFVFVVLIFLHQRIGGALVAAAFMLAVYVPMGYYIDGFVYRRRQARLAAGGERPRDRQPAPKPKPRSPRAQAQPGDNGRPPQPAWRRLLRPTKPGDDG